MSSIREGRTALSQSEWLVKAEGKKQRIKWIIAGLVLVVSDGCWVLGAQDVSSGYTRTTRPPRVGRPRLISRSRWW